jgi:uncharacterized membrane protein
MFRKYFVTGLLLWVPLAITLWVLSLIVSTMDQTLSLLPRAWHPHTLIGHDIPGLGLVLTVVVVFVTGLLTANFVGSRLVTLAEKALARIPIVRGIYSSVKQVSDTILSPNGNAFRKALLIQYPRVGSWSVAFMTGSPTGEIVERSQADGAEMVSVFLPTTPNPTSGFFMIMRRDECIELEMTVDAALRYVVSMGVVAPTDNRTRPLPMPLPIPGEPLAAFGSAAADASLDPSATAAPATATAAMAAPATATPAMAASAPATATPATATPATATPAARGDDR